MAKKKKFFNTKVKNKRKNTIKIAIITVSSILLIILAILIVLIIKNKNNEKDNNLLIKKAVSIEINETVTDEMFFNNKNPNLKDIVITYPEGFTTSKLGEYDITIKFGEESFTSKLNVIDTTAPVLVLKDLKLNPFRFYNIEDFIESCTDNSNEPCNYKYYEAKNDNNEIIDYEHFMKKGTYEIKIVAYDNSGNEIVKKTKLIIENGKDETSQACEYGDNTYDTSNYVLASDVTNNSCALNPALYKDETTSKNVNTMLANETKRLKKDLDNLKLEGTIALNRTINIIMNTSNTGIVGFEIVFTTTLTNNNKNDVILEYKINTDAKRVFIVNKYNLAE